MRILIDIGHPAHTHLFKNFSWEMQKKGHKILFTARDKEITVNLLKCYNFDFVSFGKPFIGIKGKIFGLLKFNYKLLKIALRFKPDIFLSHGSIYAAQVSWLLRKPHISMEDTGNIEQIFLYKPFTAAILTSKSFKKKLGKRQLYYNGYHEISYLHPKYYQPDESILNYLGMKSSEIFTIIRLISWNASHDLVHVGLSYGTKKIAVHEFLKFGKVFITSESPLLNSLKKYQINIPPEKIHDALYFATLFYGESATMASEAAVLGTPAIFLNNVGIFYTREEEDKYGLVFNFTESQKDQKKSIEKGIELLKTPNLKQEWHIRRQKMLGDKIDVTSFMVWFVENYPESFEIMRKNPDYQFRFRK